MEPLDKVDDIKDQYLRESLYGVLRKDRRPIFDMDKDITTALELVGISPVYSKRTGPLTFLFTTKGDILPEDMQQLESLISDKYTVERFEPDEWDFLDRKG